MILKKNNVFNKLKVYFCGMLGKVLIVLNVLVLMLLFVRFLVKVLFLI